MAAYFIGLTQGWTSVTLALPDPESDPVIRDDIEEWLEDPTVPGQWQVCGGTNGTVHYYFSDSLAAKSFKMQWGSRVHL